jgi:hypothetical protein
VWYLKGCSLSRSLAVITSLTISQASLLMASFLAPAIHLQHHDLAGLPETFRAQILPHLIQMETLRLVNSFRLSFQNAAVKVLLAHNRSGLKWHHAVVFSDQATSSLHLSRPHSEWKRPVVLPMREWFRQPIPTEDDVLRVLAGGWDAVTVPLSAEEDLHKNQSRSWETIRLGAPSMAELTRESVRALRITRRSVQPLAACRSLRDSLSHERNGQRASPRHGESPGAATGADRARSSGLGAIDELHMTLLPTFLS